MHYTERLRMCVCVHAAYAASVQQVKPSPIRPDDPSQLNNLGSRKADGNGNGKSQSRGTCYKPGVLRLAHGPDAKRPHEWTTGGEHRRWPNASGRGFSAGRWGLGRDGEREGGVQGSAGK